MRRWSERANPGGSIKDGIALSLIEDAERSGALKMARRSAREEGLLVGISSGAALRQPDVIPRRDDASPPWGRSPAQGASGHRAQSPRLAVSSRHHDCGRHQHPGAA